MKNYIKFSVATLIMCLLIILPTACTPVTSTTATYHHYTPAFTGSQSDFARYETISEKNIESVSDNDLTWVVNYCLQQSLSDNNDNYLVSWEDQVLIYQNEQIRRAEVAKGSK
jgi:hypothetical protein